MPYRTLLATSFEYKSDLRLYSYVGFEMHTMVCGIPLVAAALTIALGSSAFHRTTGRSYVKSADSDAAPFGPVLTS